MAILETLYGIIILFCVLYYYYTSKYNFWIKRGIPGPRATLFFGTIKDVILGKKTKMEYINEIYNKYKDAPLVGIFEGLVPVLVINDPILIKEVLITSGANFSSRGKPYAQKADPLSRNLTRLEGEASRQLRTKISPVFTPNKIKSIFPLLLQRSQIFTKRLDKLLSQNEQINCSDIMKRLTADFTAICLFGYDMKIMDNENDEILYYANNWSKANWKNKIKELLLNATKLYDLIGYYLFDNAKTLDLFTRFTNDITKYREKHGIVQHDIASVFMELKQNPGKLADIIEITNEFIIANYGALFVASFDTSGVTITNTLYEMALNQSIQNKLREEIRNVYAKCNGEITFNDMNTMEYLDAVIKETLRKYPINDAIPRLSSSTYKFRDSHISIPKDQHIIIPVYAIHYDPEIYPKPEVFDPERFLNEVTSKQSMVYIPFGHGLRNCIGKQFGLLQTKMGIITVLQNYKVDICEKTMIPYEHSVELSIQQPKDIYLKINKID